METMLEITPIPAFCDNYIWLLKNTGGRAAAVVDPGDAGPVLEALGRERLHLGAILITHHHPDHTGGIGGLKAAFPDVRVYGPAGEPVAGVGSAVEEGGEVRPPGIEACFEVLGMPGHTAGHVAYYGGGALFCGDVLFAGGCGRVFEGTMEQMAASLARIGRLPPDTLIYCAHEYTLANLGFARWVEPENRAVRQRWEQARALRNARRPTVPSRLELELETNPFLRTRVPAVIAAAEQWAGRPLEDQVAVFTALRNWKDRDYD